MPELNYVVPTVGQGDTTEEPLIPVALTAIKNLLNGGLDSENLGTNSVENDNIADGAVTYNNIDLPGLLADGSSNVGAIASSGTDLGISVTIPTDGFYLLFMHGTIKTASAVSTASIRITCTVKKNGNPNGFIYDDIGNTVSGTPYQPYIFNVTPGFYTAGDVLTCVGSATQSGFTVIANQVFLYVQQFSGA